MQRRAEDEAWYLAQLKPNAARLAERNLARQGFNVFIPHEETTRRHRAGFVTALKPLFPGYAFISFDPRAGHWRAINSTLGVVRLVKFTQEPAQVPAALVDELVRRCDAEGRFLGPESFEPGETVMLKDGPFANFLATIDKVTPDRRVWVLLDIMGGQTRVSVDPETMRKL